MVTKGILYYHRLGLASPVTPIPAPHAPPPPPLYLFRVEFILGRVNMAVIARGRFFEWGTR